jgi:phospholipid/cholesterol/gamma-HCH transport system substrate-binding protein
VRLRNVISFLAFGAISVFAIGDLALLGVRVNPPPERTNLSMDVADVNGLVVGSNVLLRGVPIGKISSIGVTAKGASVGFYIANRYHIPVDSEMRLENLSALGETYIGLVPRSEDGPILRDGQRIATKDVHQPASISELTTSLVRVLDQIDPGALQRIIAESDAALPDPMIILPNLSRASTLLRNAVAIKNKNLHVLLDNFQTLLRNAGFVGPALASQGPYIRVIARSLQSVFTGYGRGVARGAPQTVLNFTKFIDRFQNLLDDRGPDLKVLLATLQPQVNAIAGSLMNFDTGQLLHHLLDAIPPDGTVTLRVAIPAGN